MLFVTTADIGMALGYRMDGRDSIPGGSNSFSFTPAFKPALGPTQPPIHWVSEVISPRVKRPGRKAEHSPTFSVGSRMVDHPHASSRRGV
jgi:hypothetical protein